jgi:O-antigen ligase
MAHAPFRQSSSWTYFDHAHNDYVQFMIETGVIGLGLLGVFVLGHVLHAIRVMIGRRRRSAAAATFAALMAILAQAIHATADFNLQIPANAASLLVLMALAATWSGSSSR